MTAPGYDENGIETRHVRVLTPQAFKKTGWVQIVGCLADVTGGAEIELEYDGAMVLLGDFGLFDVESNVHVESRLLKLPKLLHDFLASAAKADRFRRGRSFHVFLTCQDSVVVDWNLSI